MPVDSDAAAAGQNGRLIYYYREPHIVVTSQYVQNAQGRYQLSDLGVIDRVHTSAHRAKKVAVVCGAVELVFGALLGVLFGSAILLFAGLLSGFGLAMAALLDSRRNPRWMVLRAVYRGRRITLLISRDRREFEQVRFAVIRAAEAARCLDL